MWYAKWSSTLGSALCLLMACSSAYTPRILAQVDAGADAPKVGAVNRDADALFVDGFDVAETGVCAGFYAPSFEPVLGQIQAASGNPSRPLKGEIQADPNFLRRSCHRSRRRTAERIRAQRLLTPSGVQLQQLALHRLLAVGSLASVRRQHPAVPASVEWSGG